MIYNLGDPMSLRHPVSIVLRVALVLSRRVQYTLYVYYGVALVSRIDKILGLFCKRTLLKKLYSAKETYNLIDPTNRSHPTPDVSLTL